MSLKYVKGKVSATEFTLLQTISQGFTVFYIILQTILVLFVLQKNIRSFFWAENLFETYFF